MKKNILLVIIGLFLGVSVLLLKHSTASAYNPLPAEINYLNSNPCLGAKKTGYVPFIEISNPISYQMSLYSNGGPASPSFNVPQGTPGLSGNIGMYAFICDNSGYSSADFAISWSVNGGTTSSFCIFGNCGSLSVGSGSGQATTKSVAYPVSSPIFIDTSTMPVGTNVVNVVYSYRGYYKTGSVYVSDPSSGAYSYTWPITINIVAKNKPTCPNGPNAGQPYPDGTLASCYPPTGGSVSGFCSGNYATVTGSGNSIISLDLVVDRTTPQSGFISGGGTTAFYEIGGNHYIDATMRFSNGTTSTWSGQLNCDGNITPPVVTKPPIILPEPLGLRTSISPLCDPFAGFQGFAGSSYTNWQGLPEVTLWAGGPSVGSNLKIYADGVLIDDVTYSSFYYEPLIGFWWSIWARYYNVSPGPFFGTYAEFASWWLSTGQEPLGFQVKLPDRIMDGLAHQYTIVGVTDKFGVKSDSTIYSTTLACPAKAKPLGYYDLMPFTNSAALIDGAVAGDTYITYNHKITNLASATKDLTTPVQVMIRVTDQATGGDIVAPVTTSLSSLGIGASTALSSPYLESSIKLGSLTAGRVVCTYITVQPGSNKDATSASLALRSSFPQCMGTSAKPYLKTYGADVKAGGAFAGSSPNCTATAGTGSINTYATQSGGLYRGSSAQFGVSALMSITGFSSASLTSTSPTAPKVLTFNNAGNSDADSTYGGGNTGGSTCITDYWNTQSTSTTTAPLKPESLAFLPPGNPANQGKVQYTLAGGSTLTLNDVKRGTQMAIYVDGDLFINDDVTYQNTSLSGSSDIKNLPLLVVIVRGNIRIAENVTRLDGLYVAQPKPGDEATKGKIYTCAPSLSTYNPAELRNVCDKQLVINGSLVAQQVKFLRSYKSISDAPGSPEIPINFVTGIGTNAAEVINYTPEMYLAPSPLKDVLSWGSGSGQYDAIYSLPPVY